MKLLLDTHAFLWAISSDSRLSSQAVAAFEEGELLLSAASVWEIVTKYQIGRLELPSPPSEFLPEHFERNAIGLLPILPRHVFRLERLPLQHKDPFDRILVAQALEEGLAILTNDPQIAAYGAPTVW
ncbi:MAG: type II toxin-antitoxin system VapC family toxin [Bryobacterales bacterium]|nr:type II toxin-antitoxin system VapC family toxin [Bryobacterales bacterium]